MNPQVANAISQTTTWLQLIIQIATVATLIYTLTRFIGKPNRTQDDRLEELERWRVQVDTRLAKGDRHFHSIDDDMSVMLNSQLAILDAMVTITDNGQKTELSNQRSELRKYITERNQNEV